MRVLWLIALASCYKPATDAPCELRCEGLNAACPGALTCSADGFCTDGRMCNAVDASDVDALVLPACTPKAAYPARTGAAVNSSALDPSYTHDLARTIATYEDQQTLVASMVDSTNPPDWTTLIPNDDTSYHAPHINPEGDEVYVLVDTDHFGISGRISASFPPPLPLIVIDETDTPIPLVNTTPSAPTARGLGQRRMVINVGPEIVELADQDNDLWKVIDRYMPSELALSTLAQPQLTADGRNMVFIGNNGTDSSIYTTSRDSMAARFAGRQLVIEDGVEKHPFLSQDCQAIYYFSATSSTVIKAQ